MGQMTNAQSVGVLDAADDFTRKLRWLDFQMENEAVVYGDYTGWQPGTALMRSPRNTDFFIEPASNPTQATNCPRPMIDLLDDNRNVEARCKPCGVTWIGLDPCFLCGRIQNDWWASSLHPRPWG